MTLIHSLGCIAGLSIPARYVAFLMSTSLCLPPTLKRSRLLSQLTWYCPCWRSITPSTSEPRSIIFNVTYHQETRLGLEENDPINKAEVWTVCTKSCNLLKDKQKNYHVYVGFSFLGLAFVSLGWLAIYRMTVPRCWPSRPSLRLPTLHVRGCRSARSMQSSHEHRRCTSRRYNRNE